jgi:hypothetical protein
MYNTVLLTEIAKLTTRNTGADSYTAIKIMACHKSRWKAATKSKEEEQSDTFRTFLNQVLH